jgi:hypothetical protein
MNDSPPTTTSAGSTHADGRHGRLTSEVLRRYCDQSTFGFETTADLEPYVGLIGMLSALCFVTLRYGASLRF